MSHRGAGGGPSPFTQLLIIAAVAAVLVIAVYIFG